MKTFSGEIPYSLLNDHLTGGRVESPVVTKSVCGSEKEVAWNIMMTIGIIKTDLSRMNAITPYYLRMSLIRVKPADRNMMVETIVMQGEIICIPETVCPILIVMRKIIK